MMKINQAATYTGLSPSTIRTYTNQGKLQSHKTPGGHRLYTQEDLDTFLGKPTPKQPTPKQINGYYIRSSNGDKTLLQNQLNQLTQEYGKPDYIYKDNASGLNDKRKGLQRAINHAKQGKITHLYVTNPDRLTRFGYNYLQQLFNSHNVTLTTLHSNDTPTNLQDELLKDFMSLITSFSGKYYRLRGTQQKQNLLNLAHTQLTKQ